MSNGDGYSIGGEMYQKGFDRGRRAKYVEMLDVLQDVLRRQVDRNKEQPLDEIVEELIAKLRPETKKSPAVPD